jgi:CheY-like chemotaxis protein/HPt (histidine-containing phosphotransfer) domain-containing protein
VRIATHYLERWRNTGPAIRIEIIDTGIGIAPQHVGRLGETFFQADGSHCRQYGGTGLGLAITRRIVEAMEGDLSVDSTLGKGSTFALTLPTGPLEDVRMIDRPAEAVHFDPATHKAAPSPTALTGSRILLVEDGPDNQLLISTLLTLAGASVEIAGNGRLGLEQVAAGGFDLVLMDIQMPEMDGYETTQELRRRGFRLPIVALTAHALTAERERCLDAGCDDYLSKPIDRSLLIETVRRFTSASPHHSRPDVAQAQPVEASHSQYADSGLAEIIDQFVATLPQRLEGMRQAMEAGCYTDLQRLAHQLKGGGGGYGYPGLTHAARRLEAAAKAADPEAAGLALCEVATQVQAIVVGHASGAARQAAAP